MKKTELLTLSNETFTSNGVRDILAEEHRTFNNKLIEAVYLAPGSIIAWPGLKTTIPTGWALCNGASFSQTSYPELFAALGGNLSPWGVSASTFSIPNIPVYGSPVMANPSNENINGGMNKLGLTGGAQTHTLVTSESPSHTHPYRDSYMLESVANGINNEDLLATSYWGTGSMDKDNRYMWYRNRETSSAGKDQPHNNMQPFAAMYWIIKLN